MGLFTKNAGSPSLGTVTIGDYCTLSYNPDIGHSGAFKNMLIGSITIGYNSTCDPRVKPFDQFPGDTMIVTCYSDPHAFALDTITPLNTAKGIALSAKNIPASMFATLTADSGFNSITLISLNGNGLLTLIDDATNGSWSGMNTNTYPAGKIYASSTIRSQISAMTNKPPSPWLDSQMVPWALF
jgi:hypothetical protein